MLNVVITWRRNRIVYTPPFSPRVIGKKKQTKQTKQDNLNSIFIALERRWIFFPYFRKPLSLILSTYSPLHVNFIDKRLWKVRAKYDKWQNEILHFNNAVFASIFFPPLYRFRFEKVIAPVKTKTKTMANETFLYCGHKKKPPNSYLHTRKIKKTKSCENCWSSNLVPLSKNNTWMIYYHTQVSLVNLDAKITDYVFYPI